MPSYKNFITGINKISFLALVLLEFFMAVFRGSTHIEDLKMADSSRLEVCRIKREFSHKVAKRIANKSMSSMGRFYGFKIHIICNGREEILKFRITS
jgi:hypothetical protein